MCKIPWRLGALSLGLALLAACDRDTPVALEMAEAPANAAAASSPVQVVPRPQEEAFHQLSRELESYGGHYFDEQGDLVVHLVEPAEDGRARQLLAPVLESRPLDGHEAGPARQSSIVVRQADFTFPQLARWRDRATNEVLLEEGVEFIDLDEVQNRVAIGVSTLRGRMLTSRMLQRHGIPAEAILFVDAQPAEKLQSLQSRFRPLVGGIMTQSHNYRACTLGVNVDWNGQRGFLTASHCTQDLLHPDGIFFYQPTLHPKGVPLPSLLNLVGREVSDPNVNPRHSAVAVVRAEQAMPFTIARTTSWATGVGNSGSVTVNPNNPRFGIIGEETSLQVHQELSKVGQATGWTYGWVYRTCQDYPMNGKVLYCQDLIRSMHSAPGDSGAPVFRRRPYAILADGSEGVNLAGILWGSIQEGGTTYSVISRIGNIKQDHGPMSFSTTWPNP